MRSGQYEWERENVNDGANDNLKCEAEAQNSVCDSVSNMAKASSGKASIMYKINRGHEKPIWEKLQ